MRIAKAGALYFALVFVCAFAFGTVRTLVLEPSLGELAAVAIEAPFLVLVMVFAARFTLRRIPLTLAGASLFGVGLVGLILQQAAEFGLVLAAGETIASHIAYLGTPPGLIYLAALLAFLLMPIIVGRAQP